MKQGIVDKALQSLVKSHDNKAVKIINAFIHEGVIIVDYDDFYDDAYGDTHPVHQQEEFPQTIANEEALQPFLIIRAITSAERASYRCPICNTFTVFGVLYEGETTDKCGGCNNTITLTVTSTEARAEDLRGEHKFIKGEKVDCIKGPFSGDVVVFVRYTLEHSRATIKVVVNNSDKYISVPIDYLKEI